MQAVDFSVRYAIEQAIPLVINLSFGNTYGSHSGTSLLETYLDSVSTLGRINIVVGSGNEGNNGGHASARLASLESAKIEFAVGNYETSLSLQIWKNYWDDIRFQLTPPGLGTSFLIPSQPGSWRFSFLTTQILVYYGVPSPYSLYQEISVDLLPRRDYISGGIWFLTAEARTVTEGIFDLWMPAAAIRGTTTQFLTPHDRNNPHDSIHSRKCDYRWSLQFFGQHTGSFFRQGIYLEHQTGQTGSGCPRRRYHQLCRWRWLRIPQRNLHGCPLRGRKLCTAHAVGHFTKQRCFSLWRKNESLSDPWCQTASIFRFLPQSAERIWCTLCQQQPDICVTRSVILRERPHKIFLLAQVFQSKIPGSSPPLSSLKYLPALWSRFPRQYSEYPDR